MRLGCSLAWTTTQRYIEADLAMKEKALSRLQDPGVVARRFRADDSLFDFFRILRICIARGGGGSSRFRERPCYAGAELFITGNCA